jgi:hypothetical protein
MSNTISDVIEPLVVDGKLTAWLKQSIYCTGSEIVLTNDGVDGVSLSVAPLPSGASLATIDLKDTEGFALRNLDYDSSGTLVSEQLPISTTKHGRVLVNAPGTLSDTDARIVDHQMIVFGSLYSQHIRAQTLTVDNINSLNLRFVRSLYVDAKKRVIVTTEDGRTNVLPLTWDMITDKPQTESVIQFLTDRLVIAQYNIDFLMEQQTRMSAQLESLRRLSPSDPDAPAAMIDQNLTREQILAEIMNLRDAVRIPI